MSIHKAAVPVSADPNIILDINVENCNSVGLSITNNTAVPLFMFFVGGRFHKNGPVVMLGSGNDVASSNFPFRKGDDLGLLLGDAIGSMFLDVGSLHSLVLYAATESGETNIDIDITLGDYGGALPTLTAQLGNLPRYSVVTATATRPATTPTYSAGHYVGTVAPIEFQNLFSGNGASGALVGVRVETNKLVIPRLRLMLFNANPAVAQTDATAYTEVWSDVAKRLGWIDLPALEFEAGVNADMARCQDYALSLTLKAAATSRSLFAQIKALDGFTPNTGQTFRITMAMENV